MKHYSELNLFIYTTPCFSSIFYIVLYMFSYVFYFHNVIISCKIMFCFSRWLLTAVANKSIHWFNHSFIQWLIDLTIDWLNDWLVNWLIDWVVGWLIVLIDWFPYWLADWLVSWLIDLLIVLLIYLLIDWLIEWVIDWLFYSLYSNTSKHTFARDKPGTRDCDARDYSVYWGHIIPKKILGSTMDLEICWALELTEVEITTFDWYIQGQIYIWDSMAADRGPKTRDPPPHHLKHFFIQMGMGGGRTYVMKDPQILLAQGPLKA